MRFAPKLNRSDGSAFGCGTRSCAPHAALVLVVCGVLLGGPMHTCAAACAHCILHAKQWMQGHGERACTHGERTREERHPAARLAQLSKAELLRPACRSTPPCRPTAPRALACGRPRAGRLHHSLSRVSAGRRSLLQRASDFSEFALNPIRLFGVVEHGRASAAPAEYSLSAH